MGLSLDEGSDLSLLCGLVLLEPGSVGGWAGVGLLVITGAAAGSCEPFSTEAAVGLLSDSGTC